ncbi:MAG: HAMP domain-containing sensor histidine kinase [Planctomycetota bacterium]
MASTSDHPPHDSVRTERGLGWWGLLPAIKLDGHRCWLPLSDRASIVLGLALGQAKPNGSLPAPVQETLCRALTSDPPLFLYALLQHRSTSVITLTELSESLIAQSLPHFASGEWVLAAPEITRQHQYSWSRLFKFSQGKDPSEWRDSLVSWLRVMTPESSELGPIRLPNVLFDFEANTDDFGGTGRQLLQQVARARMREHATEHAIDALAGKRKMSAAKQLAYGLSHEINNPLANISARAQQLERGEADPSRRQSLQQIVAQVYRAHEMIAGLMFFANPPSAKRQAVALGALVQRAAEEFQVRAADFRIQLHVELSAGDAVVDGDSAMLLEAIRVLLRNSMEAIGEGGTIVISTEFKPRDAGSDESEKNPSESAEGRWLIHVADSGPGLSPEQSRHAFDPFYSGREAGRGLGLGLCRAYRVAKLHQATIQIRGGLAGCVATIALPARPDDTTC